MKKVIIVESNTQDLLDHAREYGLVSPADCYIRSFMYCEPDNEYITVFPYEKDIDEKLLSGCDGIAFSGANVAWSVDAVEAKPLRDLMERVFDLGLPTIGSCNGMQLAASLLGGKLVASANGFEIGLATNIQLTTVGAAHPMMEGRQVSYAAAAIHRDEVQTLPEGALLLAENAHSKVQAFAYQEQGVDFWGTQYHPEMRPRDVADTLRVKNGIFSESTELISDLSALADSPTVAEKFGTTPQAQTDAQRTLELRNWLRHL
jgi:GMP synthase (glutamine-hydrolysing)